MAEEPTTGIFDSISGAKSRDPDLANETANDTQKQPPVADATKAATVGDEDPSLMPRRLKGRIAELEQQLSQLDGWAQLGVAVGQTPEGQKIIERWQRGEQLFASGQGGTPGVDRASASEPPLTMSALQIELNRREAGRRQMDDLTEIATDNLPEFKKISKSPVYAGKLDATLQAVWNGSIPVADEAIGWADQVKAKNYTAMKEAYEWYLKGNDKVVKAAKEAGKKEAAERAEAALAGEHTSSSMSDSVSETPPKTEEDEMIERMMKARGLGRSFGTVGRGRPK